MGVRNRSVGERVVPLPHLLCLFQGAHCAVGVAPRRTSCRQGLEDCPPRDLAPLFRAILRGRIRIRRDGAAALPGIAPTVWMAGLALRLGATGGTDASPVL